MRKIGGDLSKDHATRVSDYLLTQGIDSVVEVVADGRCELWARQEDQLVEAKQHLQGFLAEPDSERFRVNREAETLRRKREKENREKLRLQQKFQPRATSITTGSNRATFAIIALCAVASLLTNFGNERPRSMQGEARQPSLQSRIFDALTLLPETAMDSDEKPGPLDAVMKGQVWRLITPIFLHGDPMHLVFNALFLFSFGRIVETICGPKFLVGLFLVGGIVGMLAQAYGPISMGGSPRVIGASGGALALFSFLWLRPNFEPSIPFRIPSFTLFFVMGFVILSMLPMAPIGNVANLAHLGGLAWGAAVATGLLDFLRR
jgi:GlpG protein